MFTFSKTHQQNLTSSRAYARARARALARAASRAATRAATRAKVANKIAKKVIKGATKIVHAIASITSQEPEKDKAMEAALKKAVRAVKRAEAFAVCASKIAEQKMQKARSLAKKARAIVRVAEPVKRPASDVDSSSGIPEQGAEQLPASSSEKSEHAFAQGATREFRMFLRTLACFFPKFSYDDDENANDSAKSSAQDTMRNALESGEYQVRISPKHSGSLGLWNIEKRFFQAKNSACNLFTKTSQIILAYIIASFCDGDTLEDKLSAAKEKIKLIERDCAGLCIGMEVVTRGGITGQHGDTPHVNYAVVTSVCRTHMNGPDRFFGASEVVDFCCKYGLLWNEALIITSLNAFNEFCEVYETKLVNGTDSTVMPLLRELADKHIPAIPHSELQGEILEGVVVRLEPREDKPCADLATRSIRNFSLETLRAYSNELDTIWSKCGRDDTAFVKCIQPKLDAFWGSDETTPLSKEETNAILASIVSMNPVAEGQVDGSSETAGIQGLVALMRSDKAYANHVCFKGLRLRDGSVCFIVHVRLDKVFATFNRNAPKGMFPLYRGYSFIVETPDTVQSIRISHMHDAPETPMSLAPSAVLSCMFKAKFMPYMIRTFIMRNCGMTLVEELMKGDPSAISNYNASIERYLKSWVTSVQMSSEAFSKYYMYLVGWGKFISKQVRTGGLVEFKRYLELIPVYESMGGPSVSGSDSFVPPSNGSLIFMTYPCDVPAECKTAFHQQMAEKYGPSTHILFASDKSKTFEDLVRFKELVKSGITIIVVVSLASDGLWPQIQEMVKPMKQVAWWVYSGIPKVENPFLQMAEVKGAVNKAKSLSKKWVDFLSCSILPENQIVPPQLTGPNVSIPKDFDLASFFPATPIDPLCLLEEMQKRPVYSRDRESKVCVITFPAIPGSGKSTLASQRVMKQIAELTGYDVSFRDGDDPALKDKFWPKLWDHINSLPLYGGKYLIIASKNAPVGGKGDLYKDIREKCPAGVKFAVALAEEGGIPLDGFPFSLEYLALCMSRVVRRTKQDHNGLFGRDAWQISTMFYNIYAGLTRDDMLERIAVLTESVIDLPVVSKDAPQMPDELQELLHSCIRGDSLDKNGKSTNSVPTELVLEAFEKYADYLASIKVPLADYEEAFVQQVEKLLKELSSSSVVKPDAPDFEYVGAFVKDETAYAKVLSDLRIERKNSEKPHVTLLHSKNKGASDMFPTMFEYNGMEVLVCVDAIVMSSTSNQIAFQVKSMTFLDGTEVPVVNSWPHMTVSCESGCAWLSNCLPQQVKDGTATKTPIEPTIFTCVVDWVKK
jgi:hypothetical protein